MDNRKWLKGKKIPIRYRENIDKRSVIELVVEKSEIPKSWKREINKGKKSWDKSSNFVHHS
jgi:hypothetical protein